jgi:ribosome-binding protein aMBF1 (putative translation factor)
VESIVAKIATVNWQPATANTCYKVSPKKGDEDAADLADLVRRAKRGQRVREIRKATGMTGEQFAARLSHLSSALEVPAVYDKTQIAKLERGTRILTAEEAAILASIDPDERGVDWLVFGDVSRKMGARSWRQVG